MKKSVIFLVFLVLISILWTSCEKEQLIITPDDNPNTSTKYFTVEVSASKKGGKVFPEGINTIQNYDDFEVRIVPDTGYVGVMIVDNDTISFNNDSSYLLPHVKKDYKINVTFEKTLSWYFMHNKWKLDSIWVQEFNGSWSKHAIWGVPTETQQVVSFLPNDKTAVYWDGKYVGDSPWIIDETVNPPTLVWGNSYIIEVINDSSLVLFAPDAPCLMCGDKKTSAGKSIYSRYE